MTLDQTLLKFELELSQWYWIKCYFMFELVLSGLMFEFSSSSRFDSNTNSGSSFRCTSGPGSSYDFESGSRSDFCSNIAGFRRDFGSDIAGFESGLCSRYNGLCI